MEDPILNEQIEYYRARAKEYDGSISGAAEIFESGKTLLSKLGMFDSILELACGTGFWTEVLMNMGKEITAVDAAPEMLEIARQRLGSERILYQQADLFRWIPEKQYGLVFFGNWLSHVPPSALDNFLHKVRRAVRPNGILAMVDQYAPSIADEIIAKDDIYAVRPLEDGRRFTIVKAFYSQSFLEDKLRNLGFDVAFTPFTETFFFLSGKSRT